MPEAARSGTHIELAKLQQAVRLHRLGQLARWDAAAAGLPPAHIAVEAG